MLGQIARALWEGMVTLEYVREQPDRRMREQLLVEALHKSRQIALSQWGREYAVPDLDKDASALIQRARTRERRGTPCVAWKARKADGEDIGPFDHDKCAEPPTIEKMAKRIGAHDQYEVVYRMESTRATHWGLHGLPLPEQSDPSRLLQSIFTIAACYGGVLFNCAEVLDVPS